MCHNYFEGWVKQFKVQGQHCENKIRKIYYLFFFLFASQTNPAMRSLQVEIDLFHTAFLPSRNKAQAQAQALFRAP